MSKETKNVVLFDLDGTLALIDHRRHLVEKPKCLTCRGSGFIDFQTYADSECPACHPSHGHKKFVPDWDAFHAACVDDRPNPPVIAALHALAAAGYQPMIVSGRSDVVLDQTLAWLAKHIDVSMKIVMRPAGDFTADHELKRRWLNDGTIPRDRVLCVYDDRQKVVDMWRAEGVPCFQVAPGAF